MIVKVGVDFEALETEFNCYTFLTGEWNGELERNAWYFEFCFEDGSIHEFWF